MVRLPSWAPPLPLLLVKVGLVLKAPLPSASTTVRVPPVTRLPAPLTATSSVTASAALSLPWMTMSDGSAAPLMVIVMVWLSAPSALATV
ncbi:hypothetical protein FQZ97_1212080 [compost metagenome]